MASNAGIICCYRLVGGRDGSLGLNLTVCYGNPPLNPVPAVLGRWGGSWEGLAGIPEGRSRFVFKKLFSYSYLKVNLRKHKPYAFVQGLKKGSV